MKNSRRVNRGNLLTAIILSAFILTICGCTGNPSGPQATTTVEATTSTQAISMPATTVETVATTLVNIPPTTIPQTTTGDRNGYLAISNQDYTEYLGYGFEIANLVYDEENQTQIYGMMINVKKPSGDLVVPQATQEADAVVDDLVIRLLPGNVSTNGYVSSATIYVSVGNSSFPGRETSD